MADWLEGYFENKKIVDNTIAPAGGTGEGGDMTKAAYDPANINQQVVGTTAAQTLTNKTLTTPNLGTPSVLILTNATDATNKRFCTDAEKTKLTGIEALADVTDAGNVGSVINAATGKTTPADADTLPLIDSAASNALKKLTWADLKTAVLDGSLGSSGQFSDIGAYAGVNLGSMGPQTFVPTDAGAGTLFASPSGSGTACTIGSPCTILEARSQAVAGDVIFLRGGTYTMAADWNIFNTGTLADPIIYESYPGELAVLDGSAQAPDASVVVKLTGDYIRLRNIEIKNMPKQGVSISGNDNILDHMVIHGCRLSGIQNHFSYTTPYTKGLRNIIRGCTIYANSDAGLTGGSFANGGNADGISISSGTGCRVENCLVYGNSDDGIDTWRSIDSYVGYNIVHSTGIADGNGNGIKAGGAAPSATSYVEHNLVFSNAETGIDFNSGVNVTLINNTTFDNLYGYRAGPTTTVSNNISNSETANVSTDGTYTNNSWQRTGTVEFSSTTYGETGFLVPFGSGEINKATNKNTSGLGFYKQKTGDSLDFYGIDAASNKLTVALDAAANTIDIGIVEANLSIPTAAIQANAVGNARMAKAAASTVKMNATSALADLVDGTVEGGLTFDGVSKLKSKGSWAFNYLWDTRTETTDPGTTKINLSADGFTLVVHSTSLGGRNLDPYFDLVFNGEIRIIANNSSSTSFAIFDVNSSASADGTFWTFGGAMRAGISGTAFTGGQEVLIQYVPFSSISDVDAANKSLLYLRRNALNQIINESDTVISGTPVVANQAALPDVTNYDGFTYRVDDQGLYGIDYQANAVWSPTNGVALIDIFTNAVDGNLKFIWPASTFNGPYTCSNVGGKLHISCGGTDYHGLTEAIAIGCWVVTKTATGVAVGAHKVTGLDSDTTGLIIETNTNYSGTPTITTMAIATTVGGAGSQFTVRAISIPALRINSAIELWLNIASDTLVGAVQRHTFIKLGSDTFHDMNYSSVSNDYMPMKFVIANAGSVSAQRAISCENSTGLVSSGSAGPFTGTTNTGSASTLTITAGCDTANVPVEYLHGQTYIKG